MRVAVLTRDPIEYYPPTTTVIQALRAIGVGVTLVCPSIGPSLRVELESLGVEIREVFRGYDRSSRSLAAARRYLEFRRGAWRVIDDLKADLYWVASAMTALALGHRILRYPYVLHLLELYDRSWAYRAMLGRYARSARRVVASEYCRSVIQQMWWKLTERPAVMPNKPLAHPRVRGQAVVDGEVRSILESIPPEKRMVLYQGRIFADRDLSTVAQAVHHLRDTHVFVAMGPAGELDLTSLRRACPGMRYIPRVTPPGHLAVTSHAHIGVAFYSLSDLNNLFCAPNKIWEYSGFGIPVLGNHVPGLQFSIGSSGAGTCVDMSTESVIAGILEIERHYDQYSSMATRFFDSLDLTDVIREVVELSQEPTAALHQCARGRELFDTVDV